MEVLVQNKNISVQNTDLDAVFKEQVNLFISNEFSNIEDLYVYHKNNIDKLFNNMPNKLFYQYYKNYYVYTHSTFSCVYFIYNKVTHLTKIGSSNDPIKRLKQLSTMFDANFGIENALELISVIYVPIGEHKRLEFELHEKYKKYNVHGEWFKLNKKQIQSEINAEYCIKNWCISIYDDYKLKVPNRNLLSDDLNVYLLSFKSIKNDILDSIHKLIEQNPKNAQEFYQAYHFIEHQLKNKIYEKFDISCHEFSSLFLKESSTFTIYKWLYEEKIHAGAVNFKIDGDNIQMFYHFIGFGDNSLTYEDILNRNVNDYLSEYNL